MRWISALLVLVACGSDSPSDPDAVAGSNDAAVDGPSSQGCGGPAGPTGAGTGTIMAGGLERTYVRFVPASYDPAKPYPLIFAWHGRTGNGTGARQYFHLEDATADQAIIVYPDGLPVTDDPGDTGWVLTPDGRDIALFDALQAELTSTYCVGRTYSMGHSFGGYMTNVVGCYRGGSGPNAVRAIGPMAGGGPNGSCPGGPVSAVVIHGIEDMVVLFEQGEGSRDAWLAKAGCDATSQPITPAPCVAYDGCDGGNLVRFCAHSELAGNGHAWPSFASPAIWALFQASP
ncbi:MAG: hypothetical protein WKG01_02740 [Kofleriaceae bacterium]